MTNEKDILNMKVAELKKINQNEDILNLTIKDVEIMQEATENPNIEEIISVGLGGLLRIGIIESIQIPCVYKLGAEKGRIQMVIVTALVALLAGGIIFIGEKANIQLPANNILNILNTFLPLIFIGLTMIIYYISYKVAYKIYDKKEI